MDAKVLSFGDVLLRECDVATLEPSQWLNDKIIEFYFEYLSRTLLGASDPSASAAGAGAAAGTASSSAGGESSSNGAGGGAGAAAGGEGNNSAVLLVGPSVSFWLNICPSDDDVTETMAPLGVENKEWKDGKLSEGTEERQYQCIRSRPIPPPLFLLASSSLPGRFLVASWSLPRSSSLPPRFLLASSSLPPSLPPPSRLPFASYNAAPDASATKSARSVPSSFKISFLDAEPASLSSPLLPLIALAVNDNNDPTLAEAGSHWSLLLFIRSRRLFLHFDSVGSHNLQVATALPFRSSKGYPTWPLSVSTTHNSPTLQVASSRRLFLHFDSAGSHNLEAAKGLAEKLQALLGVTVTDDTFQSASTPQQLNGYDCGVYVLAIATALCETASAAPEGKASAEELESSAKGVDAAAVTKLRGDVKQLIQHLGKQSRE
ncbi:unnamed protein product [Closterium sp. Naga37s-1]|nr:unnamed protein product [Closterium sp. Naga37s-1]